MTAILIALGTSSSEAALPGLISRLEQASRGRSGFGLLVPAAYSFNLDGTDLYLKIAVLFIA